MYTHVCQHVFSSFITWSTSIKAFARTTFDCFFRHPIRQYAGSATGHIRQPRGKIVLKSIQAHVGTERGGGGGHGPQRAQTAISLRTRREARENARDATVARVAPGQSTAVARTCRDCSHGMRVDSLSCPPLICSLAANATSKRTQPPRPHNRRLTPIRKWFVHLYSLGMQ